MAIVFDGRKSGRIRNTGQFMLNICKEANFLSTAVVTLSPEIAAGNRMLSIAGRPWMSHRRVRLRGICTNRREFTPARPRTDTGAGTSSQPGAIEVRQLL